MRSFHRLCVFVVAGASLFGIKNVNALTVCDDAPDTTSCVGAFDGVGKACTWNYRYRMCSAATDSSTELCASRVGPSVAALCASNWDSCRLEGSTCTNNGPGCNSDTAAAGICDNTLFDSTSTQACKMESGQCVPFAPLPSGATGCASYTTSSTCRAAMCYFDVWENAVGDGRQVCFDNVGQVMLAHDSIAARTCSYWTTVESSPEAACSAHGCTVYGLQCIQTYSSDTAYGQNGILATSNTVRWSGVNQIPDSDSFEVDVDFVQETNSGVQTWYAVVIGSRNADIASSVTTNFEHCTSFVAINTATDPDQPLYPVPTTFPSGTNLDQLRYNIYNWIENTGTLDFSNGITGGASFPSTTYAGVTATSFVATNAYRTLMEKFHGNFRTGSSIDDVVRGLSIPESGGNPQLGITRAHVQISLSKIRDCPGVTVIETDESQQTIVPLGLLSLSTEGGVAGAFHSFYATQSTSGQFTITPNSAYRFHVVRKNAVILRGTCAEGEGQLVTSYTGTYYGVLDSSIVVGPQSSSDIHSTTKANEDYLALNSGFNAVVNQYFETTTAFTPSTCDAATATCSFSVQRTSECRALTSNGLAFIDSPTPRANLDSHPYLINGVQQLDISPAQAYALLRLKHDFYVDTKSCFNNVCTSINAAPDGSYDPVLVSFELSATPAEVFTSRYEVTAGLLDLDPTVDSAVQTDLAAGMRALVKIKGQLNGVDLAETFPLVDANANYAIPYDRALAPVIRTSASNLNSVNLRLGIGASDVFRFTALRRVEGGNTFLPVNGLDSKDYPDIKPFMTHVPKRGLVDCPTCLILPAVATIPGSDAFRVPIPGLYDMWGLLDGNFVPMYNQGFQGVKMELTYYDVDIAGRRLLEASSNSVVYNTNGAVTATYVIAFTANGLIHVTNGTVIGNGTTTLPPPVVTDHIPSHAEAKMAASTGIAIAGVFSLYVISYVLTK